MRLISLNIWGGRVHQALLDFVKNHAEDTDIFCFQEVYKTPTDTAVQDNVRTNIYAELEHILPGYTGFYMVTENNYAETHVSEFGVAFGQAVFVKTSLGATRLEYGVSEEAGAKLLLGINVRQNDKVYSIINFHGVHDGQGKIDNEKRLAQSKAIQDVLKKINGLKILCGDFNVIPETQSLSIMAEGMRNLIKENNITSTRSSLYTKGIKYADYTLVSPDVQVIRFKMLLEEVSDHLAMLLEFA